MNRATVDDGCRIAWRMDGPEGAPVLMLAHALGASSAMWGPQVEAFSGTFRVLRYDARGHGASDVPAGPYTIERLGRDALGLLDALGLGGEKVVFCGLSMGGFVGQWLGANAPDRLEKLILANTSAYMGPPEGWRDRIETVTREGMAAVTEATLARWFTADFRDRAPEAVDAIRKLLMATSPQGFAGCAGAIAGMDLRGSLAAISVPTLIIGNRQDPSTTLAHAEALHAAIPGSQLAVLPAAHLANIEAAEPFNAAIRAFVCG